MIQSEWDSPEQNYIYFIFAGRWNWDELGLALVEADQMAASVKRPLCYVLHLFDEVARRHVPPHILANTARVKSRMPPNVVKVIIVNASSVTFGIMSVVFRLSPDLSTFYGFAPTMEDAERIAALKSQTHNNL
jgi:hypothetical protein